MACAKIKRTKYMRNINDNAVQGRLSENYLTRNIIAWNILDTKYSRFTVLAKIYATEYFCSAKVAGLSKIFIQRKFLVVQYYGIQPVG